MWVMIEIAIIGCDIFILSKGVIPLYAGKQPYNAQVHVNIPGARQHVMLDSVYMCLMLDSVYMCRCWTVCTCV